jgi:phage-related protein
MAEKNSVMIKIEADIKDLQSSLSNVEKSLKGLGDNASQGFSGITNSLKGVASIIGSALAVDKIKDFGMYALESASDVEEMENKFNVVFSEVGSSVDKWASKFGEAIGRTKTEIKTGVTNLGDLLTGYGMTQKEASALSQSVIELSYDLASFNNVQDADAIDRMTKGILGEHEGLKALGIAINETTLQNKMMEMGLTGQFAKLDEVTKAQVRYQIMLDQTKNAQGDAVRSADAYANSTKNLKAQVQQVAENFGKELLPLATDVVNALIPVIKDCIPLATEMGKAVAEGVKGAIDGIKELGDKFQQAKEWIADHKLEMVAIGVALGVLGGALVIAALQLDAFGLATQLATAKTTLFASAQALLTGAMTGLKTIGSIVKVAFNPYTLAIMGAIAVGYLIIKNWDTICEWAKKMAQIVKDAVVTGFNWCKDQISNIWNSVTSFMSGVWNGICNVVQTGIMLIGSIISGAFTIITLPFQFIWQNCKDTVTTVFNSIKAFIGNVIQAIVNVIKTYLEINLTVWRTVLNAIWTVVSTIFNKVKSFISTILSAIRSVVSTIWNGIKSVFSSVLNAIFSVVSNIFNRIKSTISNISTATKTVILNVWNGIKSVISNVGGGIKSTVSNIFNGVKNTISNLMNGAKNLVSNAWNSMRGIFSKVLKPNIKLPHLSISGKLSLNPPSVPKLSVKWFETGSIFTGPSVIGVGENGDEAVVPLSNKRRMKPFAQAVSSMIGADNKPVATSSGVSINISQMVVREETDIKKIAEELNRLTQRKNRQLGIV